jgi:2-iminobutanoate/2-iminopropanoate deaminase
MVRRPAAHQPILSRKVPRPTGPYAQALLVSRPGDILLISGQLPHEPPHGSLFSGPVQRQAELVFGHIKNLVLDARFSLGEIVKVSIYLTDLKHEAVVDKVYQNLFVGIPPPARLMVEVSGLRGGASIEAEAMAIRQAPPPPVPAAGPEKNEPDDEEGMY